MEKKIKKCILCNRKVREGKDYCKECQEIMDTIDKVREETRRER